MTKPPRDPADKPKDLPLDKASMAGREGAEDGVVVIAAGTPLGAPAPSTTATTNASKPGSPAALSPSPSATDQKRAVLDVTSQGVQTTATSTFSGPKHEEKEEKKEAVQEWVEGWEERLYILVKSGDYFSHHQQIPWNDSYVAMKFGTVVNLSYIRFLLEIPTKTSYVYKSAAENTPQQMHGLLLFE